MISLQLWDVSDAADKLEIDLFDLIMKVKDFARLSYIDEENETIEYIIHRVFRARAIMDSARILLRNLITPENNIYIMSQIESYNWMIDNLGRCTKNLNEVQSMTFTMLNTYDHINKQKLMNYLSLVYQHMEHLVYFPLRKALDTFYKVSQEGDVVIKKDDKLFLYFVFLELYHSSESLGAIASEERKSVPAKGFGVTTTTPSHTSVHPPEIPFNAETISKETKEMPDVIDEAEEDFNLKEEAIFGGFDSDEFDDDDEDEDKLEEVKDV